MKLTRFINKSYFTVAKFFITKLAYIDSRTYMSAYNALLQRVGVKMGGVNLGLLVPRYRLIHSI